MGDDPSRPSTKGGQDCPLRARTSSMRTFRGTSQKVEKKRTGSVESHFASENRRSKGFKLRGAGERFRGGFRAGAVHFYAACRVVLMKL